MNKIIASFVAEFLGTFVLVFTIGNNALQDDKYWGGVSIACSLMVMIWALGASSGANFNPAVSFALGLGFKLDWSTVAGYILSQIAGGVAAGFAYSALDHASSHVVGGHPHDLGPTESYQLWQAGVAEMLYTCMLCFIVLNTAATKKNEGNQFFGLAIGFTIIAGAYSGGAVSGGCFNPAVAIGMATQGSSFESVGANCLVYVLSQLFGAILAVVLWGFVVRPEELPFSNADKDNYSMSSKLASEFIGTYFLVLTVGLNVLTNSVAPAFSIAASLTCMIFALGSVSGAHFNPAVTIAILCSGRNKIDPMTAIKYIGTQLVAGILAGFTYSGIMGGHSFALVTLSSSTSDAVGVVVAEFVYTFVLAFVVLAVATTKAVKLDQYFGLAIGMCVTVGGFAIGSISSGSLNPAVSFGISFSHLSGTADAFAYAAIECSAGMFAALVYRLTYPQEYQQSHPTYKPYEPLMQ